MLNSSITFKILPFCMNTAVPAFLPCLEASLEVPFWNCVKYLLRFVLNLFNGVESLTLHPKLQLGEEEKGTGSQIGWVWGMGDHCHVVLGQKLRNFKGPVSWSIVVVDNEVLVLPFLWPLAPHIFTLPSQNNTVEVCIDRHSTWDKFPVYDPLLVRETNEHRLQFAF